MPITEQQDKKINYEFLLDSGAEETCIHSTSLIKEEDKKIRKFRVLSGKEVIAAKVSLHDLIHPQGGKSIKIKIGYFNRNFTRNVLALHQLLRLGWRVNKNFTKLKHKRTGSIPIKRKEGGLYFIDLTRKEG